MSTLFVNNLNTASGSTITVPTGKQLVVTDTGGLNMPGTLVQLVNGRVSDDRATTTSTSFVQLGDTLTITPKFSTSKIFMLATISTEMSGANSAFLDFGKTTGGSTTQNLSGVSGGIVSFYQETWNNKSISFVDAPSTTNAIAYFVSAKVSAGTLYFNDNSANTFTQFTLMEIAQ